MSVSRVQRALPAIKHRRGGVDKYMHIVSRKGYQPSVSPQGRFIREPSEQSKIATAEAAGTYFQKHIYTPFETFDQEEMWALLLDCRHNVRHELMVYRGTVTSIQVRPAEVLKEAVRLNLPQFILAHNHPSGEPEPSVDDLAMTNRLNEAAKILDIQFLDHFIIGKERWTSLKELGHL
jgi:DNA repair protein RadC